MFDPQVFIGTLSTQNTADGCACGCSGGSGAGAGSGLQPNNPVETKS